MICAVLSQLLAGVAVKALLPEVGQGSFDRWPRDRRIFPIIHSLIQAHPHATLMIPWHNLSIHRRNPPRTTPSRSILPNPCEVQHRLPNDKGALRVTMLMYRSLSVTRCYVDLSRSDLPEHQTRERLGARCRPTCIYSTEVLCQRRASATPARANSRHAAGCQTKRSISVDLHERQFRLAREIWCYSRGGDWKKRLNCLYHHWRFYWNENRWKCSFVAWETELFCNSRLGCKSNTIGDFAFSFYAAAKTI